VTKAVVPLLTVKRAAVFTPDWGPRPWGWEPDRVLPAATIAGGCCDWQDERPARGAVTNELTSGRAGHSLSE
jgi:hypothetical protein